MQTLTRPTLILVAALALTGCADVVANVAINVAGPVLIEPAFQLVAVTVQLGTLFQVGKWFYPGRRRCLGIDHVCTAT